MQATLTLLGALAKGFHHGRHRAHDRQHGMSAGSALVNEKLSTRSDQVNCIAGRGRRLR